MRSSILLYFKVFVKDLTGWRNGDWDMQWSSEDGQIHCLTYSMSKNLLTAWKKMTKTTKKKLYTSNRIRTKYSEIFITVWKLFQEFIVNSFSEFWYFYFQTEEIGLNILVVPWNSNFLFSHHITLIFHINIWIWLQK